MITIFEINYAFGALLMTCELCQRINLTFDECSEMIEQLQWYLFPPEIQRIFPTILNFAQQSIEINCFGSMTSDRETFKYVRILGGTMKLKRVSNQILNLTCAFF